MFKQFLKYLIAIICINSAHSYILDLPNGKIRGIRETTPRNATFYAYFQIPYAQPPLGPLRFQAPLPVESWTDTLDCTKSNKICYQTSTNSASETEDCLYINVYTPLAPGQKGSLPVLFYIYGGGFVDGDALYTSYGPHFFMEHNIIVVTISYRVGPFGFLSTNDDVILGNNGLKDQNLGLQWVQKNIYNFGGDAGKVTIFGQSAGAASVAYQLISEKSRGLFRAAIGQSGTVLAPWSYQRQARDIAYSLANRIDSNFTKSRSSNELLELLQRTNASTIDSVSRVPETIWTDQMMQGYTYAPVKEPLVKDAFITKLNYDSVAKGQFAKVPLLMGIASEEAIYRALSPFFLRYLMSQYDKNITALVQDDFHLTDEVAKTLVANSIRSIYTDGLFENDLPAAIKYFSDASFNRPVIKHAELYSRYADVHFYQFSYRGHRWLNPVNLPGTDRVSHGEDTFYLWPRNNISNVDFWHEDDVLVMERYVQVFADFCKYSHPGPELSAWPVVDADNFQYLNINKTWTIEKNPKGAFMKKWDTLYNIFAATPLDTY